MKRVLLAALLIVSAQINAQITIDSGNVANLSDVIIQEVDTNTSISLSNYTSNGGSQSWSFTALANHEKDTFDLEPVSTGWGNSYFSGSDYTLNEQDSTSIYISKSNSLLNIDGIYQISGGDTINLHINTNIITFPSTNGTSFTNHDEAWITKLYFGTDPDGPGPHDTVDSLGVYRHLDQTSDINAWGTATMNQGPFDVIRQNAEDAAVDSLKMKMNGQWQPLSPTMRTLLQNNGYEEVTYDTTWVLRFWSNDYQTRLPLVEIDYADSTGTINSVTWLDVAPTPASVWERNAGNYFNLYPNPATDRVSLETTNQDANSISVLSINGQEVLTVPVSSRKTNLNTGSLAKGLYLYKVKDTEGNTLHSGKLSIR